MRLEPFKRGDTFALYVELTDIDDEPLVFNSSDLRAEIRDRSNKLITTLTVEAGESPNAYLIKAANTLDWPAGTSSTPTLLYMDIEITNAGIITSSETIEIPIVRDVTMNG